MALGPQPSPLPSILCDDGVSRMVPCMPWAPPCPRGDDGPEHSTKGRFPPPERLQPSPVPLPRQPLNHPT